MTIQEQLVFLNYVISKIQDGADRNEVLQLLHDKVKELSRPITADRIY